MAKPSKVHRPTEDAAIGRVRPKPLAGVRRLLELLAGAVRRRDRHGAQLLRSLLARLVKPNSGVVSC